MDSLHIPRRAGPQCSPARRRVAETAKLAAAGHDPRQVVTHLVRTYLKQLLEDGFFHWEVLGKLAKFAISYVMSKGPLR
jgi:hypothetical protein